MEDRIVHQIQETFRLLPKKSKPRIGKDGIYEWVPLSGIAIITDDNVQCLALGTGMKCLPSSKLADAKGNILHDWHAETLALRAFNRLLLDECIGLASGKMSVSSIVRRRSDHEIFSSQCPQPFSLHDNIKLAMYCSEAPCGDASMELVMEAQDDATPWLVAPCSEGGEPVLLGRGSFSQVGMVRRKPARGDSPSTSCKSCSDKLALKQCISVLSGPVSILVSPVNAYLETLILPVRQHRKISCDRAFGATGRMKGLSESTWAQGYSFRPFKVTTTNLDFKFSRDSLHSARNLRGSNIATAWTPNRQETIINGVLAGRKQLDPGGRSVLSRRELWQDAVQVIDLLSSPQLQDIKHLRSYAHLKQSDHLKERERVKSEARKEALKDWFPNSDDNFDIHGSSPDTVLAFESRSLSKTWSPG